MQKRGRPVVRADPVWNEEWVASSVSGGSCGAMARAAMFSLRSWVASEVVVAEGVASVAGLNYGFAAARPGPVTIGGWRVSIPSPAIAGRFGGPAPRGWRGRIAVGAGHPVAILRCPNILPSTRRTGGAPPGCSERETRRNRSGHTSPADGRQSDRDEQCMGEGKNSVVPPVSVPQVGVGSVRTANKRVAVSCDGSGAEAWPASQ